MYLNTLICLEENVGGYGKNGERPTGHITITSPGIVKCYVQNLRQLPKEYTVYLISKNQNKAVRLGNINVCDGNKQVTWKVDLNNINGTGLKGTDIDSAAVICEGDSIGNTDTILIGYTQGKYLITSMLESALPKKTAQAPQKPETSDPAPKVTVKKEPKIETQTIVKEAIEEQPNIETKQELNEKVEEEPKVEVKEEVQEEKKEEPQEELTAEIVMPEEGTGSIITPDIEGPGPVILPNPSPDVNSPEKEGGCNDQENGCKIYVPLFEDGNVTEVELLRNLQEAFSNTSNKEELAKKIERIIYESVTPIHLESQMRPADNEVDQEEEKYLNQIESVLKNIQDNIGEELKEKKTLLEDEPSIYKEDMARVRDLFNDSDAIEPFEKKDPHIEWVRISMPELISIPQLSYEWCTNPVITYCYQKFGFLILGKDQEIEQYYIGIPDIYDTKRDFILSIDKIEAFRGQQEKHLQPGDYGYWIVRI